MPSRPRSERTGIGYPTANRELARRVPTFRDPNGYYRMLGLRPDATEREVKRRCRMLLAWHHPDGKYPDEEAFRRVSEVYEVIGDPVERAVYDHTPDGAIYVDASVKERLNESARNRGVDLEEVLLEQPPRRWTYTYEGDHTEDDDELAEQWYEVLIDAAAEVGYRGRLRLVLSSRDDHYMWGEEVMVPRQKPSRNIASQLFSSFARNAPSVG